jgi:NAD(P)-dependent dehydrogenase (short-subunit alcohol dehydrogenase family)
MVGRSLTDQLLAAGATVRALSRRPENADLPAGAQVIARARAGRAVVRSGPGVEREMCACVGGLVTEWVGRVPPVGFEPTLCGV